MRTMLTMIGVPGLVAYVIISIFIEKAFKLIGGIPPRKAWIPLKNVRILYEKTDNELIYWISVIFVAIDVSCSICRATGLMVTAMKNIMFVIYVIINAVAAKKISEVLKDKASATAGKIAELFEHEKVVTIGIIFFQVFLYIYFLR